MSACTTRPPASGTTSRRPLRRSGLWVRRDSVRNSTRVATGGRIGSRRVIWRKSGGAASPLRRASSRITRSSVRSTVGGTIPPFLALLVRFRGKTIAARDRRGDIGIPLLLEHLALPLGGEKPSKMAIWQMHRPWARRTVAFEAGQRILSHLVSHPDLLTTLAALFYYPPWRGLSPCALEALRGPSGGAIMTTPGGAGTRLRIAFLKPTRARPTGFYHGVGVPRAPTLRSP